MNLRTTNIIVQREYLNRVKKKSFLIITFLVPILFVGIAILPSLIMYGAKESAKDVAVVDRSGIVLPYLQDTETIHYQDFTMLGVDSVKNFIKDLGMDVVLSISPLDEEAKTGVAIPHTDPEYVKETQLGFMTLDEPVTFRNMGNFDDTVQVNIMFMMAIKEAHGQIEMLQKLMGLFVEEDLMKRLHEVDNFDDFIKIIEEAGLDQE